jgi:hypothetical protein
LALVALATLLRLPLVEPLGGAAPFITYTCQNGKDHGHDAGPEAADERNNDDAKGLLSTAQVQLRCSGKGSMDAGNVRGPALINAVLVSGLVAALLRHELRQLLLFRELQHRSQTLFAVIQAIASRPLTGGQTLSIFLLILVRPKTLR